MEKLLAEIRACQACAGLPLGPRPLLQASPSARILIAGQAPGRITHARGIPFDDPSGNRLRDWLGLTRAAFYDPAKVAIVPMGFCFPGTGKTGDLPPRRECAPLWRNRVLAAMPDIALTILLGRYALQWHLPQCKSVSLASLVRDAEPDCRTIALPHPSPRNTGWLRQNPWFEAETLPALRTSVAKALS